MGINPNDYMMNLRGKSYLPVAPRIVMMREAHPDWTVVTEPVVIDELDALVKATVLDAENRVIATAHKTIKNFAGGSFEKAETGAIGRALSLCGFGTIQAGDMDEEEDISDAPIQGAKEPPRPSQVNGNARQAKPKDGMVFVKQLYRDDVAQLYGAMPHMINALRKHNASFQEAEMGLTQATGLTIVGDTEITKATARQWYDWLVEYKEEQG